MKLNYSKQLVDIEENIHEKSKRQNELTIENLKMREEMAMLKDLMVN